MNYIIQDTVDWAIQYGRVPQSFFKNKSPESIIENFPEEVLNKLNQYFEHTEGKSVILTGADSLLKDKFAVCLLLKFIADKHKVIYFEHPNQQDGYEQAWATAIMRIDLLIKDKFQLNKFLSHIVEIITKNYVFITSCSSLQTLKNIIGESTSTLLVNNAVEVEIPVEDIKILKI